MLGTRSRRYPLFWSQYGRFSDAAPALTAQYGAVVIDGKNADELFTGLVSRVEALDRLTTAPITRDVAVVQLKRALPDPLRRIELFDLVDQAVTQITDRATHKPVSVPGAWPDNASTCCSPCSATAPSTNPEPRTPRLA
ncbi:hypothetical protein ADL25_37845 [Streptomyces sp. NRRL F-5122]|uniref:hypothetical protein n=1 Tax=Streptomyces sp. NRRL F-5122 TaxID=1609098 RepID=UPI000740DE86|nr:hypothetical protein [Streptomyces sp. NRRL F-5122]KUJ35293.1 hypothetical protein ADL25_37845 [Streptomyces sp. NRRL F-5122]